MIIANEVPLWKKYALTLSEALSISGSAKENCSRSQMKIAIPGL